MNSDKSQFRTGLPFIIICVILFVAVAFILGEALRYGLKNQTSDSVEHTFKKSESIILAEGGSFLSQTNAPSKNSQPNSRHLDQFYHRRAYPGAPPIVPHPVDSDMNPFASKCLTCHQHGGYVPKFNAYAPVTPHPQLVNCRQCHVPQVQDELFKISMWQKPKPPSIHQSALPGSPPYIPHSLHMREKCLSCHSGPSAIQSIKTTHPERVNCRQCHMVLQTTEQWERP